MILNELATGSDTHPCPYCNQADIHISQGICKSCYEDPQKRERWDRKNFAHLCPRKCRGDPVGRPIVGAGLSRPQIKRGNKR